MTKEQKDKILKALTEERNDYVRECEKRITAEQGKIMGADYMLQRFLDILKVETKTQENKDIRSLCDSCTNNECIFQSGIIRNRCDFYIAESEEDKE